MVEGNTHHNYKEVLTLLEDRSPGTKAQLYFGFLTKASDRFARAEEDVEVVACDACGSPTVTWEGAKDAICSFCRMKRAAAAGKEAGTQRRPPRARSRNRNR